MFEKSHGIIVSCDVKSVDELKNLVISTAGIDGIVGYKLGFMLGLRYGLPDIVSLVKDESDLPVIYDYQKAGTDIPEMADNFASIMKDVQVDSAIIFPQAGPATHEAFVNALKKAGVIPMVGGEMTHPQYLEKDGGYIRNDAPEDIYKLAASLGVEYFIVPGNKPDSVKKYAELLAEASPKFCMPGIGRQGGDIETAFNACGEFDAYAIIGAAIYKSSDVKQAAKKFCETALRFA
ncbi:MAG: orotidine 5'-phosphate decarboxylase [Candidatus Aenigmarchaeota archaeon]|nr:orotidine 5'-phosphate decarboxylase [Candidatus Aenigmarchaeota archaeon]